VGNHAPWSDIVLLISSIGMIIPLSNEMDMVDYIFRYKIPPYVINIGCDICELYKVNFLL
jgi:hypothetical protein